MRSVVLAAMLTSLVACGSNKFDSIYQAGQALHAAVDTSVNFARYKELVLALNTELMMANEKASDAREAELLNLYWEAIVPYTDALTLWILKEQQQTDLLARGPVLDKLLEKYDVSFDNDMIPVEATIKKIWPVGKVRLDKANAAYRR